LQHLARAYWGRRFCSAAGAETIDSLRDALSCRLDGPAAVHQVGDGNWHCQVFPPVRPASRPVNNAQEAGIEVQDLSGLPAMRDVRQRARFA
jgi:hypothetical protein